jgi:mono/diheme cytochrome c family protein
MRKPVVVLGVFFLILAAVVMAEEATIEEAPLTWKQAALGDGEQLYAELCAVCHGVDGTGGGPAAVALKAAVPDLTTLSAGNDGVFPAKSVQKAITGEAGIASHGTLEMPIWGRAFADVRPDVKPVRREAFSKQRIYNLTTYLESLQQSE